MRKNYSFLSKLTGLMFVVVMVSSLTSCEDIFGKWDKPGSVVVTPNNDGTVTVTMTSDGAEIANATLPSEITEKLATLKDEIAAKDGEEFVVDIKSTSFGTNSSDNAITIPSVDGAKIKLNFMESVSTDGSEPLELKSESTATESSDSKNELTVALPSNSESSSIALNLDMPETTVNIESADGSTVYIEELTAKTATNTLIVSNTIVKYLRLVGGTVKCDAGSNFDYLLADYSNYVSTRVNYDDLEVTSEGVTPYKMVDGEKNYFVFRKNSSNPYYFKKLSVVGSSYTTPVKLYLVNTGGSSSTSTKPVLDELEIRSWPWSANALSHLDDTYRGTTSVEIDNFSKYDNGSAVEKTLGNGDYEIKKVTAKKIDDLVYDKSTNTRRDPTDNDYIFNLCFEKDVNKVDDDTTNGGFYPFPYIKDFDPLITFFDRFYNDETCPTMHGTAAVKHFWCGIMQIDITGSTDIALTHFQGGGANEGLVVFNIKSDATGVPEISLTNCKFQRRGCSGKFVIEDGSSVTGVKFIMDGCYYGNRSTNQADFIMKNETVDDGTRYLAYRGDALSIPVTIVVNGKTYTAEANNVRLTEVTE